MGEGKIKMSNINLRMTPEQTRISEEINQRLDELIGRKPPCKYSSEVRQKYRQCIGCDASENKARNGCAIYILSKIKENGVSIN